MSAISNAKGVEKSVQWKIIAHKQCPGYCESTEEEEADEVDVKLWMVWRSAASDNSFKASPSWVSGKDNGRWLNEKIVLIYSEFKRIVRIRRKEGVVEASRVDVGVSLLRFRSHSEWLALYRVAHEFKSVEHWHGRTELQMWNSSVNEKFLPSLKNFRF